MKRKKSSRITRCFYLSASLVWLVTAFYMLSPKVSTDAKDKLEPEELIAKHLESIAPRELLESRKSFLVKGQGEMHIRVGGSGMLAAPATFLTANDQIDFLMNFQNASYLQDRFVYDGKDVEVAFIQPGVRSPLGEYLFTYKRIMQEGLPGGVLSMAWPLIHLEEKDPKFKYKGLKNIDGEELHELEYRMKKSGGIEVEMHFEPETFYHRHTKYRMKIPAGMGANPNASAGLRNTYQVLDEYFSDYKDFGSWKLPSKWRLINNLEGNQRGSLMAEWIFNVQMVEKDVAIPPGSFRLNN